MAKLKKFLICTVAILTILFLALFPLWCIGSVYSNEEWHRVTTMMTTEQKENIPKFYSLLRSVQGGDTVSICSGPGQPTQSFQVLRNEHYSKLVLFSEDGQEYKLEYYGWSDTIRCYLIIKSINRKSEVLWDPYARPLQGESWLGTY